MAEVEKQKDESKKKRSRSSRKKPAGGTGIVTVADRFVCSYSGRMTAKAIIVPGLRGASFANIPCGVAWIEENIKTEEERGKLLDTIAEEFDQPRDGLIRAPDRAQLAEFGGDKHYPEWMGALVHWDQVTEDKGTDVKSFKSGGRRVTAKKGKKNEKITLESGMYSVSHNKSVAGVKKVNTIDGVEVEKGTKGKLTAAGAARKINTFLKSNNPKDADAVFRAQFIENDGIIGHYCTAAGEVDKKLVNLIASKVLGVQCYGPAVLTLTKKHSALLA
jgi:hypothetical protein